MRFALSWLALFYNESRARALGEFLNRKVDIFWVWVILCTDLRFQLVAWIFSYIYTLHSESILNICHEVGVSLRFKVLFLAVWPMWLFHLYSMIPSISLLRALNPMKEAFLRLSSSSRINAYKSTFIIFSTNIVSLESRKPSRETLRLWAWRLLILARKYRKRTLSVLSAHAILLLKYHTKWAPPPPNYLHIFRYNNRMFLFWSNSCVKMELFYLRSSQGSAESNNCTSRGLNVFNLIVFETVMS